MTQPGSGGARPTLSLVSSASSQTASLFPAFAVGSLAPLMGEDLSFGAVGLSSAVAFFFLLPRRRRRTPDSGRPSRPATVVANRKHPLRRSTAVGGHGGALVLGAAGCAGDRRDRARHRRARVFDHGGPGCSSPPSRRRLRGAGGRSAVVGGAGRPGRSDDRAHARVALGLRDRHRPTARGIRAGPGIRDPVRSRCQDGGPGPGPERDRLRAVEPHRTGRRARLSCDDVHGRVLRVCRDRRRPAGGSGRATCSP